MDSGHRKLEMGAANWQNGSLPGKKKCWQNKLRLRTKNLNPQPKPKAKLCNRVALPRSETIFWVYFEVGLGTSSI